MLLVKRKLAAPKSDRSEVWAYIYLKKHMASKDGLLGAVLMPLSSSTCLCLVTQSLSRTIPYIHKKRFFQQNLNVKNNCTV